MKSSICLAMMAHNEAHFLPIVRRNLGDRISHYVIMSDPPNSDDTIEVAKAEFGDLIGEVIERPWPEIDNIYTASIARNQICDAARAYNTDYILWLDPDSPLEGVIPDDLTHDIYAVYTTDINSGISWVTPQILKSDVDLRWRGRIHEYLDVGSRPLQLLTSCSVRRNGSGGGVTRMRNQDLPILLNYVKEKPKNQRAFFYLAQTYRDLGEIDNAIRFYKRCAELPGFDQVTFYAMYMVGYLYRGKDDTKAKAWLLKAFAYRPTRVEPLNRLHELCFSLGEYQDAYQYLKNSLTIPPSQDTTLVERRLGT